MKTSCLAYKHEYLLEMNDNVPFLRGFPSPKQIKTEAEEALANLVF